jgi:hypothetical protein
MAQAEMGKAAVAIHISCSISIHIPHRWSKLVSMGQGVYANIKKHQQPPLAATVLFNLHRVAPLFSA